MSRRIHPIEVESYGILRTRVDTRHLPRWTRAVTERVVHSSADVTYVEDLVCDEESLVAGATALAQGAPLVVDAAMVGAGITTYPSTCLVRDPAAAELAASTGDTRSAAAFRLAAERVGPGAVWVVGNAPTALFALLDLDVRPALVVGLPVGFVGSVESKEALRASGLPAVTNRSEKGGSAIAAAAVNALLYGPNPLSEEDE
ncbi:MAG TPA: precorrin-8X methylmutase [Mycobacteriales bacterium]|jgi:precorrin-8X/cobalt-precorrin-8 methylmutase